MTILVVDHSIGWSVPKTIAELDHSNPGQDVVCGDREFFFCATEEHVRNLAFMGTLLDCHGFSLDLYLSGFGNESAPKSSAPRWRAFQQSVLGHMHLPSLVVDSPLIVPLRGLRHWLRGTRQALIRKYARRTVGHWIRIRS